MTNLTATDYQTMTPEEIELHFVNLALASAEERLVFLNQLWSDMQTEVEEQVEKTGEFSIKLVTAKIHVSCQVVKVEKEIQSLKRRIVGLS